MNVTRLAVPKMDCAGEERLVRIALEGRPAIVRVDADLAARQVIVLHEGAADDLAVLLRPLNLGVEVLDTRAASDLDRIGDASPDEEARTLKIVLAINATMFVAEVGAAVLADSSALLADSLDMFADATVYGIALVGARRSTGTHVKAARISGALQLLLAAGAFIEVVRRLIFGSEPEAPVMAGVAAVALVANATSMWLLARHRHGGAHMRASWIFTTNDVVANLGVIVAAGLVRVLNSNVPDLVVAAAIASVVLSGAIRILRLKA